jgi:NADPH:quinone reductase-like Zn-dependent oxidoreductase
VPDRRPSVLQHGGTFMGARPDAQRLTELATLVDSGRLHLKVQQTFPLAQAADAHRLIETRKVRGKLVLTIRD